MIDQHLNAVAELIELSVTEMEQLDGGSDALKYNFAGIEGAVSSTPSVSEMVVTKITDSASTNLFRA